MAFSVRFSSSFARLLSNWITYYLMSVFSSSLTFLYCLCNSVLSLAFLLEADLNLNQRRFIRFLNPYSSTRDNCSFSASLVESKFQKPYSILWRNIHKSYVNLRRRERYWLRMIRNPVKIDFFYSLFLNFGSSGNQG